MKAERVPMQFSTFIPQIKRSRQLMQIEDNRDVAINQAKLAQAIKKKTKDTFSLTKNKVNDLSIQFKVEQRRIGEWYSSYDPYTIFPTKREAVVYDRKLKNANREELRARVPTLYTYTHTKPANKLSFALQGPHTAAHKIILKALVDAKTVVEVFKIFDEQILTPTDVEEVIFADEVPISGTYSRELQERLERYVKDYEGYYDELLPMFKTTNPDLIKIKHLTNILLNMDPYAVYAWKTTAKASHASLSGKGESLSTPAWDDLFDAPPSRSFRSSDNFTSFVDARKSLFDAHF